MRMIDALIQHPPRPTLLIWHYLDFLLWDQSDGAQPLTQTLTLLGPRQECLLLVIGWTDWTFWCHYREILEHKLPEFSFGYSRANAAIHCDSDIFQIGILDFQTKCIPALPICSGEHGQLQQTHAVWQVSTLHKHLQQLIQQINTLKKRDKSRIALRADPSFKLK